MRHRVLTASAFFLCLVTQAGCDRGTEARTEAEKDATPTAADELKRLEGTWAPTAIAVGKVTIPTHDIPEQDTFRLTIRGDRYSLSEPDVGGVTTGTVRIDASADPKVMDVTFKDGKYAGKTELGVYELNGDTLRYCRAIPGHARPKTFDPDAQSEQALYTYRRLKPDEVAKERAKKEAVEHELDALAGAWEEAFCARDDERPERASGEKVRLTVRGKGVYTVERGGQKIGTGTMKLLPSLTPKVVLILPQDGPDKMMRYRGVYTLSEGELRVLLSESRPAGFSPGAGKASRLLIVYRRVTPKE